MVDANIATMGNQLINTGFGGSPELMGLTIFLLFAVMLWKSNSGPPVALSIGLGLCFALSLMGITVFGTIFWMGVIALGIYLGLAILNYAKQ